MLPNAYFLAKFRFDTAENEPAKNLQKKGEGALTEVGPERAPRRRPRGVLLRADRPGRIFFERI